MLSWGMLLCELDEVSAQLERQCPVQLLSLHWTLSLSKPRQIEVWGRTRIVILISS